MKILGKLCEKDTEGEVMLIIESAEDLWTAYNLVLVGDRLSCKTTRKVVRDNGISTQTNKVKIFLTIQVQKVEFEPQDSSMRVRGLVFNQNEHVKMGSRHTVELGLNTKFKLYKECWDLISLDTIKEAADPTAKAEVAAILMESGIANLCLVTNNMTIPLLKVEQTIPKQRLGSSSTSKALDKFYNHILQGILSKFKFGVLKAVIIASPGFYKDEFFKWLLEEAKKKNIAEILDHKHMFFTCHASSGHKHSLKEVLQDPQVIEKMSDVKATKEVEMLQKFFETFEKEPLKAYYGYKEVEYACSVGAIEVCLITDELFRSNVVEERKKYIQLVEDVKSKGGSFLIFSTLHVSGERLRDLTGVAAILRFPLQVPTNDDSDSDLSEDEIK